MTRTPSSSSPQPSPAIRAMKALDWLFGGPWRFLVVLGAFYAVWLTLWLRDRRRRNSSFRITDDERYARLGESGRR